MQFSHAEQGRERCISPSTVCSHEALGAAACEAVWYALLDTQVTFITRVHRTRMLLALHQEYFFFYTQMLIKGKLQTIFFYFFIFFI